MNPCCICDQPTRFKIPITIVIPGRKKETYSVWNHVCSLWCLIVRVYRCNPEHAA